MKPDNPEVIDRLASEYALGTLRGPARRRFERWRANTPFVDQRCRFWEERLMHLAKDLKPAASVRIAACGPDRKAASRSKQRSRNPMPFAISMR